MKYSISFGLITTLQMTVATPTFSQPVEGEVTVIVSSQDAQGVTQKSFDLAFLQLMEAYTLERTRVKAKEYLVSIGNSDQPPPMTSQATYVESGKKKLMVIRVTTKSGAGSIMIAGIVGAELKRVVCASAKASVLAISYGACGLKVRDVFGVKL